MCHRGSSGQLHNKCAECVWQSRGEQETTGSHHAATATRLCWVNAAAISMDAYKQQQQHCSCCRPLEPSWQSGPQGAAERAFRHVTLPQLLQVGRELTLMLAISYSSLCLSSAKAAASRLAASASRCNLSIGRILSVLASLPVI